MISSLTPILGTARPDNLLGDRDGNQILGRNGADTINGAGGADYIDGGKGFDSIKGGSGADTIDGGDGRDTIKGGGGDDLIDGGGSNDKLLGGNGDDTIYGGDGNDTIKGGKGDDVIEAGAGNDVVDAGAGNDTIYAFSWAGEPVPAQDAGAQVNAGEPVSDKDKLKGGDGADTFVFRWLIDAKDEIVAKHTDASGDIDYSGNGIAGENNNTHDHWLESIGTKIVLDYDADEGDELVFEGHTLALDKVKIRDVNKDGQMDTILEFISDQPNGGAHDNDKVGRVIVMGTELDAADITVDAGVYYGVEEPYSELG